MFDQMPSSGPPQGPGDGPRRPGPPPHGPGPRYPSLQELQLGNLRRAVVANQRYLKALKVEEAASRAAHLRYLTREARQDATRYNHATVQQFEARQRYQAALAVQPKYFFRQGLTPEERLWVHTVATMPYEFALMARYDPVVRSVGVGVVAVGAVEAAPVVYAAGEDLALQGMESGAELLDSEGTAIYEGFGKTTVQTFFIRAGVNATGQGIGNYAVTHDALQSVLNINLLSSTASGFGVPLLTNSLFSAGFSYTPLKGFKSIATGDINGYEFGRDALFNYGFGKLASGFKLPGVAWDGLDRLHQSNAVSQGVGFATYQAMLRVGPRVGYGLGLGLQTTLEHGNKAAVGATKKYLGAKVKKYFPAPPPAK